MFKHNCIQKSLAVILCLSLYISSSQAEFSFVAYDSKTGLFGVASAGCEMLEEDKTSNNINDLLSVIVPEKGVVVILGEISNKSFLLQKAKEMLMAPQAIYNSAFNLIQNIQPHETPKDNMSARYIAIVKLDEITYSIHPKNIALGEINRQNFILQNKLSKDILLFSSIIKNKQPNFHDNKINLKKNYSTTINKKPMDLRLFEALNSNFTSVKNINCTDLKEDHNKYLMKGISVIKKTKSPLSTDGTTVIKKNQQPKEVYYISNIHHNIKIFKTSDLMKLKPYIIINTILKKNNKDVIKTLDNWTRTFLEFNAES